MEYVEEKVAPFKERFEKEMSTVRIDFERIKTHGTTISPGIDSNNFKPPTYLQNCSTSKQI